MPYLRLTMMFATLFGGGLVWGQTSEWVVVGQNVFAFHEDILAGLQLKVEPFVVADSEILVQLIGIENTDKINLLRLQIRRAYGSKNAYAFYNNDFRTIVFDPDWANTAPADFYLTLGHEAGHLFCRHAEGLGPSNPWDRELEADRFGGAAVKRIEIYRNQQLFDAVMSAAILKYSENSSHLYPSRAMRLAALKSGYEEGSPCGDLAPTQQRGYVGSNTNNSHGQGSSDPPSRCRPVRTGPTSYACAQP